MLKVRITGHVENANGPVAGIVELPIENAQRLIRLGVAVAVDPKTEILPATESANPNALANAKELLDEQSRNLLAASERIGQLESIIKDLRSTNEALSAENVKFKQAADDADQRTKAVQGELTAARKEIETLKAKKKR